MTSNLEASGWEDGSSPHFGHKQFELLCALMRNASGRSTRELLSEIWSDVENPKIVGVTVGRLRQALGFGVSEGIIAIPHGYRLVG